MDFLSCFLSLSPYPSSKYHQKFHIYFLIFLVCHQSVRGIDIAKHFLDREDEAYQDFLDFAIQTPEGAGLITVNNFELLESKVIKAISDGIYVPNKQTPPIFCFGPLIMAGDYKRDGGGSSITIVFNLARLATKPKSCVSLFWEHGAAVYQGAVLNTNSNWLEKSGQRFLWVARNPPSNNPSGAIAEQEEMKLALPMNESEARFVCSDGMEKEVRGLMESDLRKLI